jgi:transcriptional regulator with XRE-family HTH domain
MDTYNRVFVENALQINLRRHLVEKKLSVYALEKRAGLKPSAIQNILQGKSKRPAAKLLQAIATEIGCRIEDLLSEEPRSAEQPAQAKDWDPKLYTRALSAVQAILDRRRISLTKEETLNYVNEVYLYSLNGPSREVDLRFAEWLLAKF